MSKWEKVKLKDIIEFTISGEWGYEPKQSEFSLVLRSTNFTDFGVIDYSDIASRFVPESILNKKRIKKGYLLVEKSGGSDKKPAGRVVYCDKDFEGTCSNFIEIVKINDKYDSKYILYFFLNNYHSGRLNKYQQQTTGIINFKFNEYLEEFCFLPIDKSIQSRIAEILTTADKAIEESEKLIAKYKRMKTGMIQDLLTKGIDENGNIRSEATHKFKDSPLGRIPVEWEVKRLGENDIFNIETGGTPSTMIKKFWTNGTIPWLSSGEIHKKVIFKTDNYITELGYKCSNTKYYPINSIIVALAGQGKTRGTVAITEIELTSNQSIAAIIVNLNSVEPYYLYYYLDLMYLDLRSISAGSGRAGLTKSILSDYLIKLPLKKEEQSRIANKLKEIDISIEIETETLSKLKRLKTGLMNDLLSGKVEVVDSG